MAGVGENPTIYSAHYNTMPYRLRRLLAVNIGLPNGGTTARIAELDPRGGAALTGRNGVGKTTLLRLVPLFYGLSPSRIIVRGEGQEDLVRFVLPTESSAIAFEYEREDDSAVRLAVVARAANGDGPEFRIYRTEFRREMFVGDDGNFRTRDEVEAWARDERIPDSGRLDTIDYRRVILHLHSEGRDGARIARLARDYSLGPVALPNLDRIVGAVTREKVSFEDLQAAVVSVIEGDQRSGHQKVLRERRRDVERWLSDRDACEAALKLEKEGQTQEMAAHIQAFGEAEEQLRMVKWRVGRSRDTRRGDVLVAQEKQASDRKAAEDDGKQREIREGELRGAAEAARAAYASADSALREFESREKSFADRDAVGWAERAQREPELQREKEAKEAELARLEANAAGVVAPFTQRRSEEREALNKALKQIEEQRSAVHDAHAKAVQRLGELESEERAKSEARYQADIVPARELLETLVGEAAESRVLATNAAPTAEEQEAQTALETAADTAQAEATKARDDADEAEKKERQANGLYGEAEQGLVAAKRVLAEAAAALERSRQLAQPKDGTVLAALRGAASDRWKTTTARVLDPNLLHRADLAPDFDPARDPSAYGLSVDLSAIEVPAWADDDELRAEVRRAEAAHDGAANAVKRAEDRLADAAEVRRVAAQKAATARAEAGVKENRAQQAATQRNKARTALTQVVADRREEFRRKAGAASTKAGKQRNAIAGIESSRTADARAITEAFSKRRRTGEGERDQALQRLNADKSTAETGSADRLRRIDAEEAGVLQAQGLDPVSIQALRTAIENIDGELIAISRHAGLVADWHAWRAEEEPRREGLMQAKEAARKRKGEADKDLGEHQEATAKALNTWKERCKSNDSRVDDLEQEVRSLNRLLDEELADVSDRAYECEPATAEVLKTHVAQLKEQRRQAVAHLRAGCLRFSEVMRGREGKIKDAIEADLASVMAVHGDARVVEEARFYVRWFELSRRQTIESLAAELKGIMDAAGSFYNQFRRFENEVANFNDKLQKALDRCSRPGQFDRFSDLHIEIVCSLRNLGFMEGLRQLSEKRLDPSLRDMETLPSKEVAAMLKTYADIFGTDGTIQVDLADHVRLQGKVTENGRLRQFSSEKQLAHVSSTGITSLIVLTTMLGFIDMIRGNSPVHVAVATDEIGRFDGPNLKGMLQMLVSNRIDVMTASPDLTASKLRLFPKNYIMENDGLIREPRVTTPATGVASGAVHG